jgi:hypothetical protein
VQDDAADDFTGRAGRAMKDDYGRTTHRKGRKGMKERATGQEDPDENFLPAFTPFLYLDFSDFIHFR